MCMLCVAYMPIRVCFLVISELFLLITIVCFSLSTKSTSGSHHQTLSGASHSNGSRWVVNSNDKFIVYTEP